MQIILKGEASCTPLRDLTVWVPSFVFCQFILFSQNNQIGRLVSVPGIVISASRNSSRATEMTLVCRNCKHQKREYFFFLLGTDFKFPSLRAHTHSTEIKCKNGFTSVMLPRVCDRGTTTDGTERACPKDPYVVMGDYCKFVGMCTACLIRRVRISVVLLLRPTDIETSREPRKRSDWRDASPCHALLWTLSRRQGCPWVSFFISCNNQIS